MGLKETFHKQGGMKLIHQYNQSGVLFTALGEFLLLGKSRTALEILRLATQLKTKHKLEKKYKYVLDEFDEQYDPSLLHYASDKVWICWFQGMDNAPEIVQKCYKSVKKHMPDKEVIVLTDENIKDYVQFPEFIHRKYECGVITKTHMTDLLRLELLIKYGGMWLDSTVFCSGSDIPSYFFDSELFFYQCLKPGRDGHSTYISSWLMSAQTNNKVLMATRNLCYKYWETQDRMVDYFLLHNFLSIVLERYKRDWKKIIPRDNATPHILLLRLFDEYDEAIWNGIKMQTPFHKLSYKVSSTDCNIPETYYQVLVQNNRN